MILDKGFLAKGAIFFLDEASGRGRHDFRKPLVCPRCGSFLLGQGGKFILLFPGDLVPVGHILGRQSHGYIKF